MLPAYVAKYFWGDDLKELNWESNKDYIVETLLKLGDEEALSWLLKKADADYLRRIANEKNLDPKSQNFWRIYLA